MDAEVRTPEQYFAALSEPRRGEVLALHELIRREAPDLEPHIRSGMVGYGTYHYRYESGREGDWFVIGLASRRAYVSLYVSASAGDRYLAETFRDRLPKADVGRGCVRIKRLSDVDLGTVAELIRAAVAAHRDR